MHLDVHERYFHRHSDLTLFLGIIASVLTLLAFAFTGKVAPFLSSTVVLARGVSARSIPVIALGDHHLAIRTTSLDAGKRVRFVDITSIVDQGKKLILHTKGGQVVVPLSLIADTERALVREYIARATGRPL